MFDIAEAVGYATQNGSLLDKGCVQAGILCAGGGRWHLCVAEGNRAELERVGLGGRTFYGA